MKRINQILLATALGSLALASQVLAHEGHEHAQPAEAGAAVVANNMSSGEIKKIDKSAAKITIQHGPLRNLNMPGMTMVFKVKAPKMLDGVKVGDKINFIAEKINGSLTLTQLEPSK